MIERQFSAGGVVIKKERKEVKVLLIKDSYGHWIWPKGHIEKGESDEEAAIREISEETGLKTLEIVKKLGKQEYYFTLKGKKIFKTVTVFLLKANAREKLKIQAEEIEDARWFSAEKALETIEYEGSRTHLKKAISAFRKAYC